MDLSLGLMHLLSVGDSRSLRRPCGMTAYSLPTATTFIWSRQRGIIHWRVKWRHESYSAIYVPDSCGQHIRQERQPLRLTGQIVEHKAAHGPIRSQLLPC
jgi:hypothetical protein